MAALPSSYTYSSAAILTQPQTTITAFEVPGTTGLAVIDGTTLSWRHAGLTLKDGVVVSLGFNGLEDSTTTDFYAPLTVTASTSTTATVQITARTSQTASVSLPSTSLVTIQGTRTTKGKSSGKATAGSSTKSSSSSSSSSSGAAAPSLGAGKTVALLGAIGGLVVYGF